MKNLNDMEKEMDNALRSIDCYIQIKEIVDDMVISYMNMDMDRYRSNREFINAFLCKKDGEKLLVLEDCYDLNWGFYRKGFVEWYCPRYVGRRLIDYETTAELLNEIAKDHEFIKVKIVADALDIEKIAEYWGETEMWEEERGKDAKDA